MELMTEQELIKPRKTRSRKTASTIKSDNILGHMNNIVKNLRGNSLDDTFLKTVKADTDYIGSKLAITPIQCVLLSVIMEYCSGFNSADVSDLTAYLGITNLEFANLSCDIERMSRMHIVRIVYNEVRDGKMEYMLYSDAFDAIRQDRSFQPESVTGLDMNELFTRINLLYAEFFNDALSNKCLHEDLHNLIDNNQQLPFCRKIRNLDIEQKNGVFYNLFLYMCNQYVNDGSISIDIDHLGKLLAATYGSRMRFQRELEKERTPLQQLSLIEFSSQDGFVNNNEICITMENRQSLFADMDIHVEEMPQSPDLKSHELITEKEMFYNATETEQLARLADMLRDDNYANVHKRLEESGMRCGINVIMYGGPGTGKTESCLQLARITGRDILNVDVAKLKSKWVGDSEKHVRGMFRYYRDLVRNSEKAPILLFNEADAIFGMRMKKAERSVDKMDNAIQDIILQEMENLDGILIATTNLETALDPAFERRFLMKIKFSMPSAEARTQIWKSMIPNLADTDAESLAGRYEFSGGQIENVSRKSIIEHIISGNDITLSELDKYCTEECFSHTTKRQPIGF